MDIEKVFRHAWYALLLTILFAYFGKFELTNWKWWVIFIVFVWFIT